MATRVPEGSTVGDHLKALEQPKRWGLAEGDEGKIWGQGDGQVLEALREMFKMKNEGKIKAVGITGQPFLQRKGSAHPHVYFALCRIPSSDITTNSDTSIEPTSISTFRRRSFIFSSHLTKRHFRSLCYTLYKSW